MLSEEEVADLIRGETCNAANGHTDSAEFCGSDIKDLAASENAGFEVTLVDGTRFQVIVTKIEEGQ